MQASPRVGQIPWWVDRQPRSKVVSKTKKKVVRKRRASSFVIFVIVTSLLAGAVMANVTGRALIAEDGVELENLKSELKIEQDLREDLLIQKVALESPERIDATAVQELGMIKPVQVDCLVITESPRASTEKATNSSFQKNTSRGKIATLSPILGEIVREIRITTLGDPERDL